MPPMISKMLRFIYIYRLFTKRKYFVNRNAYAYNKQWGMQQRTGEKLVANRAFVTIRGYDDLDNSLDIEAI